MSNPTIAKLIAENIHALPTPNGEPIRLAQFDTNTMPPAMRDQLAEEHNKTTNNIGQAVVHLIETHGNSEIITKTELNQLRTKAKAFDGQRPPTAKVYCTSCNQLLLEFNITNPDRINANGPQLRQTAGAACTCP